MDNMYEPPGGNPAEESRPTEQFWPMSQGAGGNHGPGDQDPRNQRPPGGPGPGARRRNPLHWTVGLVAAAALAAGGIVAGVSLAGHSSSAGTSAAAGSAAGPGSQAAALNTALNSAGTSGALALTTSSSGAGGSGAGGSGGSGSGGSAGTAAVAHPCLDALKAARAARRTGHPAAARAALRAAGRRCWDLRRRLVRAALRRGIDGEFTFRGQGGAIRTLAFERGVVQSVSGSSIVVRATDGTTWIWDLVSSTVVRESGKKTTTSALTSGEPVWVGGPVVSGAKDARLVVIRPPSASSPSFSPSPVPSASGSSASGS
jgi:hypothetical protein